ncbi:hypothetical protein VPH35_135358 [Triticum aestivum]
MDRFHDRKHVWLRSCVHDTYLNANSDGKTVSLRGSRASLKAAWTVHIYGEGDAVHLLLHSAAYGRYLAATATPAPLGHNGFRAEQRDYDEPEMQAIRWQAVGSGFGDDVMLRNVGGRYLRANRRYLGWNTGVSIEDPDHVSTMMFWIVEPIPAREAGMPDLPGPGVFLQCERAPRDSTARTTGSCLLFKGRSVNHLRDELADGVAFIDGQPPRRHRHVRPSGPLREADSTGRRPDPLRWPRRDPPDCRDAVRDPW